MKPRVSNRINPRQNTPRHILIKLTKVKHKEQTLKAAREKQQITHKGIPIRITTDLSIETLQARREWQDILKVMKQKYLQPRLLAGVQPWWIQGIRSGDGVGEDQENNCLIKR